VLWYDDASADVFGMLCQPCHRRLMACLDTARSDRVDIAPTSRAYADIWALLVPVLQTDAPLFLASV